MKTNCYTYFYITGDFDPAIVSERLGLTPEKAHAAGDLDRKGKPYSSAAWEFGRCDEYDAYVENQMRKTIAPLLGKEELLNALRKEFSLSLTLEVVAYVSGEDPTPCLAPPLDVMEFCVKTGTEMDVDLYCVD